jgi:SNF2 family DNA or RNA helicase
MDNWAAETTRHKFSLTLELQLANLRRHLAPDSLTIYRYHGGRRITDAQALADFDIVLTTYSTLAARMSTESPLYQIEWFRIVLDEGKT